ncbi:MAG TPA: right-handed parallel beta-helix repeat-containing protein, partial [Candidatus Hydrogenedentes bacterium]|nr:right-handed parallel beta-helix repeat-containing protein [Candidatus Hydrogenedentota bacterium]
VAACDISDTGTGGLVIEGGDRKMLAPCGHIAENNDIWNPGRRKRTHAYNVHMGGVGVLLAHNRIHSAPHQAIGLGGNDHIIEFNEIFNICQESDDCGAFYMGRNPSERGSILRYNFWRDTGGPRSHGSCAVYFDDGSGGQTVHGNVFLRAAGGNFGAVFVHGGHNNRVYNNIFVDCKAAMRHVRWDDATWTEWITGDLWKERLLKEVDISRSPYKERYPELTGFFEFHGAKRANYSARNVAVRCPMLLDGDWEEEDNLSTDKDPGFVDAAAMNFQLRDDSEVFARIRGFERIPFERIGLQRKD